MKQLPINQITALLRSLAFTHKVYLPLPDSAGQLQFQAWAQDLLSSETLLDSLKTRLNTVRSPKDLFFPQVENLYGFRVSEKELTLIENRDVTEDFVLFGVRACDARSFELLDRVFLSEPVDTYYQERREHGVVITLACGRPAETCFCSTFGIDAANPGGDISCWVCNDTLFWQANTEKGERLTEQLSVCSNPSAPEKPDGSTSENPDGDTQRNSDISSFEDSDGVVSKIPDMDIPENPDISSLENSDGNTPESPDDGTLQNVDEFSSEALHIAQQTLDAEKERIRAILSRLPLSTLTTEGFDEAHTLSIWESDKWATLSESCLSCGTCTFVCPTCHCYDIQELDTGTAILRFRCWDSCMYSEFTKMSAGQPRPTKRERFRQRYMHKLVYFPTIHEGIYSCVGCGRCLQKCPISMNIVKVIKAFQASSKDNS